MLDKTEISILQPAAALCGTYKGCFFFLNVLMFSETISSTWALSAAATSDGTCMQNMLHPLSGVIGL